MTRSRRVRPIGVAVAAAVSFLGWHGLAATAAPSEATFNYLRSEDGGNRFVPLRQLDDVDGGLNITQVGASGGTVHALFDTANDEPGQIFYRRSTDQGANFGPSLRLDVMGDDRRPDGVQSTEADLHAEGTTVHVAWTSSPLDDEGSEDSCCGDPNRDDIFYARSTDDGATFPAPLSLTRTPRDHNRDPDLAGDGDLVAIVYEGQLKVDEDGDEYSDDEERGDQVLVRVSTDGGDRWGDEVVLSMDPFGKQNEPTVGVAGRDIHVVFEVEDEERSDELGLDAVRIFHTRSTDRGKSFSAPVPLPGLDAVYADGVGITVAGTSVHVVGCRVDDELDPDDAADAIYWRSGDRGATFADPVAIAPSRDGCGKAVIDSSEDGSRLHGVVVFDGAGESDIVYLRSRDGGDSWERARPLSANPGGSDHPSVAVDPADPDRVHITWTDASTFLFSLEHPQKLPLGDGGTRSMAPEDVVRYEGGTYEIVIDGSDVGLEGLPVDALARLAADRFILSFARSGDIPGVGRAEPSDLVLFVATRLGEDTEGSFEPYFDGSEIGLHNPGEDIDAVDVLAGDLYLSTTGDFSVPGLMGNGDDVFVCEAAVTGPDSGCKRITRGLEGADAGLDGLGLNAISFNEDGNRPEGAAFLSVGGDFSLPEAEGGPSDLIACHFPEVDVEADDPAPETDLGDCGGEHAPLRVAFRGSPNALSVNINAIDLPKPGDDDG